MSIQARVEEAIYQKLVSGPWAIKHSDLVMIMHPRAWQELLKEVMAKDDNSINRFDAEPKYKGIKVYRSQDIEHMFTQIIVK